MSFRLPRLERTATLVDKDGKPSLEFHRWWQSVVATIEAQEARQDDLLAAILAAQEAAATATAAAAEANAAVETVNTAVETVNETLVTVNTTLSDLDTRVTALEP